MKVSFTIPAEYVAVAAAVVEASRKTPDEVAKLAEAIKKAEAADCTELPAEELFDDELRTILTGFAVAAIAEHLKTL